MANLKTIDFKDGITVTIPDEDGRAAVFGTAKDEGKPAHYHVAGPCDAVLSLLVDIMEIALSKTPDTDMKMQFARESCRIMMECIKKEESKDENSGEMGSSDGEE